MDEQIGLKLEEEIVRVEDRLKNLTPGSKEYSEVAEALNLLYKTRLEEVKNEYDYSEKREKRIIDAGRADEDLRIREHEAALKRDQFDDARKDRWVRIVVAGVELFVPMLFYGFWMAVGFKFETGGTFYLRHLQGFEKMVQTFQ